MPSLWFMGIKVELSAINPTTSPRETLRMYPLFISPGANFPFARSIKRETAPVDHVLTEVARRNLPEGEDAARAVAILKGLLDDPREGAYPAGLTSDEEAARIVMALKNGIERNGQGHSVGIEEGGGAYELGPGDVRTHQALRDSNVLNAALGTTPVANVQAIRDGNVLGDKEAVGWLGGSARDRLATAANTWTQGESDPKHWANTGTAYYPQNSWFGQGGGPTNITENNGGSAWANGLAWMGRWQDGGDRAIRDPSERWIIPMPEHARTEHVFQPLVDGAVNAAKLVGGWWSGADDEQRHQELKGLVNRPSPLLPKGMAPGSPQANWHLQEVAGMRDATVKPKSQDYAASQGRELTRAGKAVADNKLFWADPVTAASGGLGMTRAAVGKTLGAAVQAAGNVAKAEGFSEVASPFNHVGFLGSLMEDPKSSMTPEQYRANSDKAHRAFTDSEDVLKRYGR